MISFSSITDRNKTNLDDVSEWYITNNIVKDPPKGIQTFRRIKVGENNDIIDEQDTATDRNDAIRQFCRGRNPMVSVEYNNTSGQEAFLPYRIMKDGAFRPPILYQQDLLPLSRLPRYTTSSFATGGWTDYSKSARPTEDSIRYKQVLNTLPVKVMCAAKSKHKVDIPVGIQNLDKHIEYKPQRIRQSTIIEGGTQPTTYYKTDATWYDNKGYAIAATPTTHATSNASNKQNHIQQTATAVKSRVIPKMEATTNASALPRVVLDPSTYASNSVQSAKRDTYSFDNPGLVRRMDVR